MVTDGQIDQEIIVRSLAELFADEEGVPLIEYASTLHQLSQRDDDSFRSSLEDSEGWNLVFADDNDNDHHIVFNKAQKFWQAFKQLTDLSKSKVDALKTEIRFQHQRGKKKTRRKSSLRRRKVNEGDALLSPTATTTTTTRLRVRKVSKVKNESSSSEISHASSRGRSPSSSHRERRSGSLPRRASSGPRRTNNSSRSDLDLLTETTKAPQTPTARASSRSKGRTRRLSIGKSPRRMYDSNEGTEDDEEGVDEEVVHSEQVAESDNNMPGQLYLSTGDVEKIKQVVAARSVGKADEKGKGSWLDTSKALIGMAMPGGSSKPSSPGTKSPKACKHQHDAVISWIRVAPPPSILKNKKKTQRRTSTKTPTTTPPTHSRNNSGDLTTPHARQLQTIPMGSLFSFKSGYDT